MSKEKDKIKLIDKFSSHEKIIGRSLFAVIVLIGLSGIYIEDITWYIIYVCYLIVGPGYLLGYSLCRHCPYPCEHSTCLFLPYKFVLKIHKYSPTPLTKLDKILTIIAFAPIIIMPLFWLFNNLYLMIPYLILNVIFFSWFPVHFCKRCRHTSCPFNLVKGDVLKAD